MIVLDDLNDWVGFMAGHPQVKTPNLDALAARSHQFMRAYCTAPACAPSRAGALSGLSVQSTGVIDNSTSFKSVNPSKRLFDEMLSGKGYHSRRYGKIDHTIIADSNFPQPLPTVTPYSNKKCAPANDSGAFDWGPAPGLDSDQPDYLYAQQAIDFLAAEPTTKPFCLSVGFIRTHPGWYVPQRFFDMYPLDSIIVPNVPADDLADVGAIGTSYALKHNFYQCIIGQSLWADAVRGYLASISWVDEQIGRLVSALDASAHAKNTMVVLWSDHGFHLGEKFHWQKLALWEHATRVPCLIRMPNQSIGVRHTACVSLADLAPTILAQCGVSSDYAMDGQSLLPLISNPSRTWDRPALTTLDGVHHALRTPQWRYIRYASGERELYDEVADPEELVNLAGQAGYNSLMADFDSQLPATATAAGLKKRGVVK